MTAYAAQLVAVSEGPNILLDKPVILIGRHQECDIQIPSRKISRRHCCIAQVNGALMVRDLCSTNGIRINGNRVNEGRLNPGDELTIGSFAYTVQFETGGGASKAAGDDNDKLESCDEPIALAEPVPAPRPGRLSAAQPAREAPTGPPSLVFPDNIQMVPLSDSGINHAK